MAFAALVTAAGGVLIYLKKRKESLQTDTSEQAETDKESSANHMKSILSAHKTFAVHWQRFLYYLQLWLLLLYWYGLN